MHHHRLRLAAGLLTFFVGTSRASDAAATSLPYLTRTVESLLTARRVG
jgi:hypothetical protein